MPITISSSIKTPLTCVHQDGELSDEDRTKLAADILSGSPGPSSFKAVHVSVVQGACNAVQ